MNDVFLYDAVRTPFGRYGGALAQVRPDDLAAVTVRALLERSPGLDPADVGEVVLGNANGAGEDNRNVARMAVLLAGLPVTVPASTVNRLCGSSLDATIAGARQVALGESRVVLVGGVESMSRAPWVLPKPDKPFPAGNAELVSTALGWRLTNPAMPSAWTVSLGEATEQLRERRESPGRTRTPSPSGPTRMPREPGPAASTATWSSRCRGWTCGVTSRSGSRPADELAALPPVFRQDGTVTAGNASPLSDGASAALLGDAAASELIGRTPVARVAGWASAANEPQFFGLAPVQAANVALTRAGITWEDVGAVELNEAFAAQSLACVRRVEHRHRHRQPQRGRHRHRPPSRRLRHPYPRHPREDPPHHAPTLGCGGHLHRRGARPRRGPRERST